MYRKSLIHALCYKKAEAPHPVYSRISDHDRIHVDDTLAAQCLIYAVLDVIESENLIQNAREVGEYLISELKKIDGIKEVRGRGLMIGIEIEGSASEMRKRLLFERHIFTGGAGATTVRLLPALTLTCEQADVFLKNFKEIL